MSSVCNFFHLALWFLSNCGFLSLLPWLDLSWSELLQFLGCKHFTGWHESNPVCSSSKHSLFFLLTSSHLNQFQLDKHSDPSVGPDSRLHSCQEIWMLYNCCLVYFFFWQLVGINYVYHSSWYTYKPNLFWELMLQIYWCHATGREIQSPAVVGR